MSDEVKKFDNKWTVFQEIEKKKLEIQAKKNIIDEKRYDSQLERMSEADKVSEIAKNTDFAALSAEHVSKLRKDMKEYVEAAKDGMVFIDKSFKGMVPFFRKNLIVIGARTGGGKSSAVANIVFETIRQKNKTTGKRRKVLVITNEEKAEDFYSRIVSLAKGYHYINHDKFTPEMIADFDAGIEALAREGTVTVIDDTFNGMTGLTKTLEGIKSIFENILRNKTYYDAVIIDYYQNITVSTSDTSLDQYKVMERFAHLMDWAKNEYPAPIIVMAQARPDDKENSIPFESRIKGAKLISDKATVTIEMKPNKKELCTEWEVHKSRFTEAVGVGFVTGYDDGRFVEYTEAFRAKVQGIKERRKQRDVMSGIFDKKDKEESND